MKLKWKNKVTKFRGNLNHNEIADALMKSEVVERKIAEEKVERDYFAGVKFIKVVTYSVAKSSQLV